MESNTITDCNADGVTLTQAQRDKISEWFAGHAGEVSYLEPTQVEEVVELSLGTPLTDTILDTVIDLTDGIDTVDEKLFLRIMAAVLARTTSWGDLTLQASGPTGVGSLVAQEGNRSLKRGFGLNIMVVGEMGAGKTTLMNTLFRSKVSRRQGDPSPDTVTSSTTEVHTVTHVLKEKGVRLRLSITDTPGFGDQIDNTRCFAPIVDFLVRQHASYLKEETSVKRPPIILDTRVHALLYFIMPTGHGLKPLDVALMKRVHHLVNLIPVIAKSDGLTLSEREAFKARIREDLSQHEIDVFPWELAEDDAVEETAKSKMKARLPFAIVGATDECTQAGKFFRGRSTPWGFIDVDNADHCELPLLRDALVRVYMHDLKETTAQVHYELYRRQALTPK